jgi:hypothetical protein
MAARTPTTAPSATGTSPSSGATSASQGPQGKRLLEEIYDETTEVEAQYSGLCLLSAEEPTKYEEAEKEVS